MMKPESQQYLQQFEEVFEIAYRSGYVRNIAKPRLRRLIDIYEEITGAKSGYNANAMCREGKCLLSLMLALRTEYRAACAAPVLPQPVLPQPDQQEAAPETGTVVRESVKAPKKRPKKRVYP